MSFSWANWTFSFATSWTRNLSSSMYYLVSLLYHFVIGSLSPLTPLPFSTITSRCSLENRCLYSLLQFFVTFKVSFSFLFWRFILPSLFAHPRNWYHRIWKFYLAVKNWRDKRNFLIDKNRRKCSISDYHDRIYSIYILQPRFRFFFSLCLNCMFFPSVGSFFFKLIHVTKVPLPAPLTKKIII